MAKIYLTTVGDGTFTAPSDWPGAADSIECIGGGAGGSGGLRNVGYGQGGGGGAYSKKNGPITFSTGAAYHVGSGGLYGTAADAVAGDGGDTWFGNASYGSASCAAKGGIGGSRANTNGLTTGLGGAASAGIGDVKRSGGNGSAGIAASAGGGAAGFSAAGGSGGFGASVTEFSGGGGGAGEGTDGGWANSGEPVGGAGGTSTQGGGTGGAGGTASAPDANGHNGLGGTEWDSSHGSGGGGGGGAALYWSATHGGDGGLYGGGGGSGAPPANVDVQARGGSGAQGIIVITYTPAGVTTKTITITLTTQSGVPRASLSGLKWAFWDVPTPDQITGPPANKGTVESTDSSGVLVITVPDSTLNDGQIGWLNVTDSNGTLTQTPRHKVFAGPVAVSVA